MSIKNRNLEDDVTGYKRISLGEGDALQSGGHKRIFQWINGNRNWKYGICNTNREI